MISQKNKENLSKNIKNINKYKRIYRTLEKYKRYKNGRPWGQGRPGSWGPGLETSNYIFFICFQGSAYFLIFLYIFFFFLMVFFIFLRNHCFSLGFSKIFWKVLVFHRNCIFWGRASCEMIVSLKKFKGFLRNGWVSFGGVRASERRRKRGRRTDKHRQISNHLV